MGHSCFVEIEGESIDLNERIQQIVEPFLPGPAPLPTVEPFLLPPAVYKLHDLVYMSREIMIDEGDAPCSLTPILNFTRKFRDVWDYTPLFKALVFEVLIELAQSTETLRVYYM